MVISSDLVYGLKKIKLDYRADWRLNLDYVSETLLTDVTAINESFGISFRCNDIVDYWENIYIKKIILKNLEASEREFRLFLHYDFHILESSTGDTAYYDPDEKAIIHYKGNRYFLISGIRNNDQCLDQFATGVKEFHGLEGTWKDAEDGVLEGNPIAQQGSVDSALSFSVRLQPSGEQIVYYWICVGESYSDVSHLNKMITGHGLEYFIKRSALFSTTIDLYKKSLLNFKDEY